ncbi:MAG: hypothetical protein HYU69_17255 [Bacteroidetes bacterium]|nr:hypothetical protein [Bacteroidota bacterium]
MAWNDDDNDDDFDFDPDNMSPEEKEELDKEMKERHKRIYQHPLFKKAKAVDEMVAALIESLPEQAGEMYGSILRESSMMLAPKLAGALGTDSWLLSMQNAAIIRYHAEYLKTATSGLKMFDDVDVNYTQLLRREMTEFQTLFKEWVRSLDKLDDEGYEDEWGLFIKK